MTTDAVRVACMLAIDTIRTALSGYVYRVRSEAELQDQVSAVLTKAGIEHQREVPSYGGRYDLLCPWRGAEIVIELKLHASAASVERQAQRYALVKDVDAVVVATTSQRLAAGLGAAEQTLGGKPFHVVTLRTS